MQLQPVSLLLAEVPSLTLHIYLKELDYFKIDSAPYLYTSSKGHEQDRDCLVSALALKIGQETCVALRKTLLTARNKSSEF